MEDQKNKVTTPPTEEALRAALEAEELAKGRFADAQGAVKTARQESERLRMEAQDAKTQADEAARKAAELRSSAEAASKDAASSRSLAHELEKAEREAAQKAAAAERKEREAAEAVEREERRFAALKEAVDAEREAAEAVTRLREAQADADEKKRIAEEKLRAAGLLSAPPKPALTTALRPDPDREREDERLREAAKKTDPDLIAEVVRPPRVPAPPVPPAAGNPNPQRKWNYFFAICLIALLVIGTADLMRGLYTHQYSRDARNGVGKIVDILTDPDKELVRKKTVEDSFAATVKAAFADFDRKTRDLVNSCVARFSNGEVEPAPKPSKAKPKEKKSEKTAAKTESKAEPKAPAPAPKAPPEAAKKPEKDDKAAHAAAILETECAEPPPAECSEKELVGKVAMAPPAAPKKPEPPSPPACTDRSFVCEWVTAAETETQVIRERRCSKRDACEGGFDPKGLGDGERATVAKIPPPPPPEPAPPPKVEQPPVEKPVVVASLVAVPDPKPGTPPSVLQSKLALNAGQCFFLLRATPDVARELTPGNDNPIPGSEGTGKFSLPVEKGKRYLLRVKGPYQFKLNGVAGDFNEYRKMFSFPFTVNGDCTGIEQ